MLKDDPSNEQLDILRAHLMTYSFVDVDGAASYWEPFLAEKNPIQREYAALQLARLAENSSLLARTILMKYLGQEFGDDQGIEIIMDRFKNLWPPNVEND